MSSVEHTATFDRGLKMKIKRKSVGHGAHKTDPKHEIVKTEKDVCKSVNTSDIISGTSVQNSNEMLVEKTPKQSPMLDKDKSPKMKGTHKKEKGKDKVKSENNNSFNGGATCASAATISNGLDVLFSQVSMEPRVAEAAHVKRENPVPDPYEFNAKVEDGIGLPMKKMKVEKVETASSPLQPACHDIGVETASVAVATDPDCLGPCEPGTSVMLDGIVWHETDNGVLVVNVTWRGKTYIGTLLDATKHDWAPPRFNCDSPVSDFETRTPKGRGKRGRGAAGTPVNERVNPEGRKLRKNRRASNANGFQAPPSPVRSDISVAVGVKRKGRPPELDLSASYESSKLKRSRSSSRGTPGTESPSPVLIECPEPNCNKKYKHINGLRYHQTHAHQNIALVGNQDEEENDETDAGDNEPPTPVTRERRKCTLANDNEERSKIKDQKNPVDKDNSSNEDNIPLKEIAASSRANAAAAAAAAAASQEKNSLKAEGKSEGSKSDSSKVESSTVTSKKKDNSAVCSTAGVVATSAVKTSVPPAQIYQISGAPMGCLGGMAVVTQSSSQMVTSTVTTSAGSPVGTPIPITLAAISTPPQASDVSKSENVKDKSDKLKSKSVTRPIVPAPSPQMIALSSSVTVTHSNLSPVSTHTQMSPSLKPIQPKPTIMGETSSINPALVGLKERKQKQKKKREKDGSSANNKPSAKETVLKDEQPKCERPAVIKTTPCPSRPVENTPCKDLNVPTIELPKSSTEIHRGGSTNPSTVAPQVSSKGAEQSLSRQTQPSNLLKVNSPLRVATPDRKTPVTDDVQSPAYSDISDAVDSGSPQQTESPQKKDESASKKEEQASSSQAATTDSSSVPHYDMYGYYGTPYMLSNVPPSHMSPNTSKGQTSSKECTSTSEEKKQPPVTEESRKVEEKPEEKENNKNNKVENAANMMTQQQVQEYQLQQQKWMQQMYAHLQQLPPHAQYQYLAAYGYIDPNQYHMQQMMASDPHLRQQYEKAAEEQKRMQQEQMNKQEGEGSKQTESRPASREFAGVPQGEHLAIANHPKSQHTPIPHGSSMPMERTPEVKKSVPVERHGERESRDQSLRDKQNENHQIMKENIELKSQMDRSRYDLQFDYRYREKQQDEIRRLHMFQQQKLYEQQKRKMELASKPPELTSSDAVAAASKPVQGRSIAESMKGDDSSREHLKKDKEHHVRDTAKISPDVKNMEKSRTSEKSRNPVDATKSRPPSHSLPASASLASPSASSASLASTHTSASTPYTPYLSYPYVQPAHYGHMPFDPNNPVYRGVNPQVIGYSGAAYLHPAQLGYRVGAVESEKEKSDSKNLLVSSDSSEGKSVESVQQGSQYYSNVHKIHELKEKAHPTSHRSSPAPQKGVETVSASGQSHSGTSTVDKSRDYSNSPPTQRHVHTHHHTHVVYDTYNGKSPLMSPHHPVAAAAAMQHPYNPNKA